MSYAGHVLDMINREKQNRALRKKIKDRYNAGNERNMRVHRDYSFKSKPLTAKEIARIRRKIYIEMKKDRRTDRLKTIATLVILGTIVFATYWYFF